MKTLADRINQRLSELDMTQDQLATKVNVSQTAIHKLCTGKTVKTRNLLPISRALGVRPEWLEDGNEPMRDTPALTQPTPLAAPDTLIIQQFDAGGRMGNGGLILHDQPGVIRNWEVSKDWLNHNVKGVLPSSRLCIVTGFGDSMKPVFNPGDPLLVDLAVTTIDYDAVYFFRIGNEGFIKHIQRIPGLGLRAISANRDRYEPWTITDAMDFEIIGRVLKVWAGEDM